jgi:CheY-like chemotaxis protein
MGRRARKLRGIRVLVIDDDGPERQFLRSALVSSGATVTAAGTADTLKAAFIADVIVCDLASAETAGTEFLSELRHVHGRLNRMVPAIALVPAGTRSARVREAGAFQMFVTKPVDVGELRDIVLEAACQYRR